MVHRQTRLSGFNDHLTGHFAIRWAWQNHWQWYQCTRTDGFEGYRLGPAGRFPSRCRSLPKSEAVGQVFDGFDVGNIYGYFVAWLTSNCGTLYAGAMAVRYTRTLLPSPDDFGGFFSSSTPSFSLVPQRLARTMGLCGPRFFRVDFGSGNETQVMRFGKGRVVVYQAHFVAEMSINRSHSGFSGRR